MSRERLYQLLEAHGFQRVHAETRPGRSVRSFPADRLPLSEPVRRFLRQVAPAGLYGHQLEALSCHLDGADVGLTTRTASGKSLVFYAAALEAVARNPRARILAIYPLKALGREQEARWVAAFRAAGWPEERVARIDGDVGHAGERMQRLRRASVLPATPDILHAWLLPNTADVPELLAPEAAAAPEPGDAHRVPVIMPGSVGLDQARGNEEFHVDGVFFNPLAGALYYRGRHASTPPGDPFLTIQVPVANVVPIPGQSRMGWYHLAEGTVIPEE